MKYVEQQLAPIERAIAEQPAELVVSATFDVYDFAADTGNLNYATKRFTISQETFRKIAAIIIEDGD